MGITNGLGKKVLIEKRPLTDKAIYYKGPLNSATDSVAVQSPMYVVKSHQSSNAKGAGLARVNYSYGNARADKRGRGFLGFARQTITDTTTGIRTKTFYRHDYPFIGSVYSSIVERNNGEKLSTTDNLYTSRIANCGISSTNASIYPYMRKSTTNKYELGNPNTVVSSSVHETVNMSPCGRIYQTISTNSNGLNGGGNHIFIKTTDNSYFGDDTQNWVLNKIKDATVTHTLTRPGKPDSWVTRQSSFTYESTGLLKTETIEPNFSKWLKTTYVYDEFGNQKSTRTQGGDITERITQTGFDAIGRFPILSKNAKYHEEHRTYDSRYGLVKTLTGPNNLTTTWDYDNFGRKIREDRADNTNTTWEYTNYVQGDYRYRIREKSSGSPAITTSYDMLDRALLTTTNAMNGKTIVTRDVYDYRGHKTKSFKPYFAGESQYFIKTDYDDLGRPYKVTQPDTGYVETAYNGLTTTTKAYRKSNDGQSPKTLETIQTVDPMGNVIEIIDDEGNALSHEYDAVGNLLESMDSEGNTTSLTYDDRGQKDSMDDPDMGYWTYNYNALGELTTQTDAEQQTSNFEYDELGRKTSAYDDNFTEVKTWVYDGRNYGKGKLQYTTGKTDYNGVVKETRRDYFYDDKGRSSQVKHTILGSVFWTKNTYDWAGRPRTTEYPSANGVFRTKNTYTSGVLSKVTDDITGKSYWQADDVDALGNYTAITLDNNIEQSKTYNPQSGYIDSIVADAGNTSLQNLSYVFDTLGNLERRNDHRQGVDERFTYDNLNRMLSSEVSGQNTKSYVYDDLGNLTNKHGIGYSYGTGGNAGPHAVSSAGGASYAYDNNGNMLTGAGRNIVWNTSNKPRSITQNGNYYSFDYDAEGIRSRKAGPSGTTFYVGGLYEKHVTSNSQKHRYYIQVGGNVVAKVEREKLNNAWQPGNLRYMLHDHLGSTDIIVTSTGTPLEGLSYDPFGENRNAANWGDATNITSNFTIKGFTGHEQDDEISLVNMRGRLYDAKLGRFISADPHIQFPNNMQSFNRYSYVLNNPLSFTDPSGYSAAALAGATAGMAFGPVGSFTGMILADPDIVYNQYFQMGVTTAAAFGCGFGGPGAAAGCAAGSASAFARLNGATWNSSIKAGAIAGATTYVSAQIGNSPSLNNGPKVGLPGKPVYVRAVIAHGLVGGTASALQGGKFYQGFLSSGLTKSVSGAIHANTISVEGTVVAALVGGTISELTGGKFANGAQTAAFQYLFNELSGSTRRKSRAAKAENAEARRVDNANWKPVTTIYNGQRTTVDTGRELRVEIDSVTLGTDGVSFTAEPYPLDTAGDLAPTIGPVNPATQSAFPGLLQGSSFRDFDAGFDSANGFRWFVNVPLQGAAHGASTGHSFTIFIRP